MAGVINIGLSDPPATDPLARATPRVTQTAIRTRIRHIFLIVTTLNEYDIIAWVKNSPAVGALHYCGRESNLEAPALVVNSGIVDIAERGR
jgi:hypothetical protein